MRATIAMKPVMLTDTMPAELVVVVVGAVPQSEGLLSN